MKKRIDTQQRPVAIMIVAIVVLLSTETSFGQTDTSRPFVSGYENHYRDGDERSAESGEFLFSELQCVNCHQLPEGTTSRFAERQAPILSQVGMRSHLSFLREFVADPSGSKTGTTMPDVLAHLEDEERAEAIESLVHLMASTGQVSETPPVANDVRQGEWLFHTVGCVACHQTRLDDQPPATDSVPLPELADKYSIPGLAAFLADPISIRPSARMPHLNLTSDEARQIAAFLLADIDVEANMTVRYYEGSWQELPDFTELEPVSTFQASAFDVTLGERRNQFGMIFTGYFKVTQAGTYQFRLGSDDGSRLLIDGEPLVTVDGIHPFQIVEAEIELEPDTYQIDVEYFEQGGEEVLRVELLGPGSVRQPLSGRLFASREAANSPQTSFQIDPQKLEQGKQNFASLGCANCHELASADRLLEPILTSVPAAAMDLTAGALRTGTEDTPSADGCPDFGIDSRQIADLREFLSSLNDAAADNDVESEVSSNEFAIHSTMLTFNCYACHQRGDRGGVPRDRDDWFVGEEPEMGDEGRLPPSLDGVGAKLNTTWLNHVMEQGANDRPYMLTRMPRFGRHNVGQITEALAAIDENQPVPDFEITETERRVKVAGRFLAGRQAFTCVQCHTWGDQRSTGVQAMSLTTMTQRLNKDWFQHYMLDPNAFRPGTRMPASWPRGKTFFPDLLGGDNNAQVHALWTYLEDGESATPPDGLQRPGILLDSRDSTIIYRNFIEGAGTRAIGVGYPEDVNLAFDAEKIRLAMLWQGAFIDASRHWTGRGQGFEGPAGENVLNMPNRPFLATLEDENQAWPEFGDQSSQWRFRGYRLDEQRRPSFTYEFDQVQVTDHFRPIQDDSFPSIIRTVEFKGEPQSTIWILIAEGQTIEPVDENAFAVDDWRIEVIDDWSDSYRPSEDGRQLRVEVRLDQNGTATRSFHYRW